MLQILEKYQQYEELLNSNKNNKKSSKKKKKVKNKKQTKPKQKPQSQKKFSIKKIILWGFAGLIGASVVMAMFDNGKSEKKENKQTQKQIQKQINSSQTDYPVKELKKPDTKTKKSSNNENLLAGSDLKVEKPIEKPKVVTKKIIQHFCKSIVPFKSELIYYIKLDNKLVPAYSLDTWDGKGILFLPNETKKVISVMKFDNQTFYEIEKNKYILPDNKSVECFKRVKEINETI